MKVGLAGKFCSGKDTVAQGLNLPRFAFADGVKEELVGLFNSYNYPMSMEYITKNKHRFRGLMQVWGTDFRREFFGYDYWIHRLMDKVSQLPDVVVTDVRFPDEAAALEKAGFMVIRLDVRKDQQVRRHTGLYGHPPENDRFLHVSETALDSYLFHYTVDANMSIDKVIQAVRECWLIFEADYV